MQDAGCTIQDAGCIPRVRVFRRQVPGTGYPVSGTGYLAPGPGTRHRSRSDAEGWIPRDRAGGPGTGRRGTSSSPYGLTALLPNGLQNSTAYRGGLIGVLGATGATVSPSSCARIPPIVSSILSRRGLLKIWMQDTECTMQDRKGSDLGYLVPGTWYLATVPNFHISNLNKALWLC